MKKTVATMIALALAATATVTLAQAHDGPRGGKMLERLKAADTNADGLISRSEAVALPRLAERFDAIDANRDNQISFEELRASRKHGRGGHLKMMDTDNDGKLSRNEALAAAAARFDAADANKDGFVTPEEMKAARHAHRGNR